MQPAKKKRNKIVRNRNRRFNWSFISIKNSNEGELRILTYKNIPTAKVFRYNIESHEVSTAIKKIRIQQYILTYELRL